MKISAAIREYLIEIEVRKYTPKTIRGYRNSLNLFLRFCEQEAHIQTHTAFVRRLPYKEQKSVLSGLYPRGSTAEKGNGVTEATPFLRKYDIAFL